MISARRRRAAMSSASVAPRPARAWARTGWSSTSRAGSASVSTRPRPTGASPWSRSSASAIVPAPRPPGGDGGRQAARPRRRRALRPADCEERGRPMTVRVFVPRDAAALSVGAHEVAEAVRRAAEARGAEIALVRNGSRGLFRLEPLLEVETQAGRIAFGPGRGEDVELLFDAGFHPITDQPLCLGLTEEIPYLKRQERLTFARCGITDPLSLSDYRAHGGYRGLTRALTMPGEAVVEEVVQSGLRG